MRKIKFFPFQAFCLSSFTFNDKAVKKLMENFGCFSDKLHEDKVYEAFSNIINQSKKLIKPDAKAVLEELTNKIEEERAKMVSLIFYLYVSKWTQMSLNDLKRKSRGSPYS